MRVLKSVIRSAARKFGYELISTEALAHAGIVELSAEDRELMAYIQGQQLTMTSPHRLAATLMACKHAVEQEIAGDFVECGVWRGGNAILAKSVFERMGAKKKVYLFDTFAGMTTPSEHDIKAANKESATQKYISSVQGSISHWCYAPLEEIEESFKRAGLDLTNVVFVLGDVSETLRSAENLPQDICVLRLDTDWYESTLVELEILYPRLSIGGALLIDDFGSWEGARKAVESYFAGAAAAPLLWRTDDTGRMAVKVR